MGFLREIEDRGYPTDYLLARLRGRRVSSVKNWDGIVFNTELWERLVPSHYREFITPYTAEGFRDRYLRELRWIYYQMNETVRNSFLPYFMYSELITLLTCLRYKSDKGNKARIVRQLVFSLLSDRIKDVLEEAEDIPGVLVALEARAEFLTGKSPVLKGVFLKEGLKGAEEILTRSLLEFIIDMKTHPVIRRFFTSVIDSINITALYKHLKWGTMTGPMFINGGSITMSVLSRTRQSNDINEVSRLIYKLTGQYAEGPAFTGTENIFRKYMARQTKIMERENPDCGLILNYLWSFSAEARDLSIISYGSKMDRDIIKGEMVH